MATSLASPLSYETGREVLGTGPDRRFAALTVSALTILALAVHGYHPNAEDGGLYLAGVKRLLDPTLYPAAPGFVLGPTHISSFAPAIGWAVRAVRVLAPGSGDGATLHAALLLLHLASIWVTLFATWMLAAQCWARREARAGAVMLMACWLGLPVAGTALMIMDPYLTARSFSTPCMLLGLVGVLDATSGRRLHGIGEKRPGRGIAIWSSTMAVAVAMHPLMAAYAFAGSLMLVCVLAGRRAARVWETSALCIAVLGLAAMLQAAPQQESPGYVRIALTRIYWFPGLWRWYELMGLALPLGIVAWFACKHAFEQEIQDEFAITRRGLARMAFLVGTTASLVAFIFCRAHAATHLVARLQPLRAFQLVYMMMIVLLGGKMGELLFGRKAVRWAAATAVLGGTMFAAQRMTYAGSRHIEVSGADRFNPWMQAFDWVRSNTPKDALFALDPDYITMPGEDAQCFRAIAERSALPDYSKDGGEAAIAPELASAWVAGQAAQQQLSASETTDAQRVERLGPLGVSWLVLRRSARTSFECPYKNAKVKVCRLP